MIGCRIISLALLGGLAGCRWSTPSTEGEASLVRLETVHLPNVYRLHPKVMSGGQPEGEAGFRELQALGVRTIISVDGAKPDVGLAHKYGMRYVHLPLGYDGISEARARELAKAVRELPGPIYIHCHHGRHRSPTAAAVACVGAGLLSSEAAPAVLRAAGTGEGYLGLHHAAQAARRFDDALLDALQTEFVELAPLPPLAEAMVELDETYEHLRAIEGAAWQAPAKHPDLDPAHEALLLLEHFCELLRTEEVQRKPVRFIELLDSSAAAARELQGVLAEGSRGAEARASALLARIQALCNECHQQYRDVPLYQRKPHDRGD